MKPILKYSVTLTALVISSLVGLAHLSANQTPISGKGLVYDHTSEGDLTVVELFTSQGCSSCPPADSVLTTLSDRPNILALSWAVDYWDRLGWRDTFSSPLYSKRQRAYNRRLGRGGVYTPQLFVNGEDQAVGSRRDEVDVALTRAKDKVRQTVTPILSISGNQIQVALPETDLEDMAAIQFVWFLSGADVAVGSGENRGRSLHYSTVVRDAEWATDWQGDARTLTLPVSSIADKGADCFAVLIQSGYADGPVMGASYIAFKNPDNTVSR